jgi:hypothetical protein
MTIKFISHRLLPPSAEVAQLTEAPANMMAQKLTAKQRCLILSFHFAALTESVGLNLIGDGKAKSR